MSPRRAAARVSVVIPVRDEERLLPGLLDRLAALGGWHEVIVADGGSRDRTREFASAHPLAARVLGDATVSGTRASSASSRHDRLNAAFAIATGDVVLLLGADMRPGASVGRRLRATHAIAGCLSLRHARRGGLYPWGDAVARLRARWTRGAYLDQAPFFARAAAIRAGGFRAVGSYDTSDLGRRLCGRARAFAVIPAPVVVSCRAWVRGGLVATFLRYQRNRLRRLGAGTPN